jgi:hypothetical protein
MVSLSRSEDFLPSPLILDALTILLFSHRRICIDPSLSAKVEAAGLAKGWPAEMRRLNGGRRSSLLAFLLLLALSVDFFLTPSLHLLDLLSSPPEIVFVALAFALSKSLLLSERIVTAHTTVMETWEWAAKGAIVRMLRQVLRLSGLL